MSKFGFKSAASPAWKFYSSCASKFSWGGEHHHKHGDDDDHGRKSGHWKDHKSWPHADRDHDHDHDHDHGKAAWKWHHPHHHDRDNGCPPKNAAPVITSPAAFTIDENQTDVGAVAATDANMDAIVFSITGGADADFFAIDPALGTLIFKTAPDFETPLDDGANNVYDVIVRASDGKGASTQAVQVTVADVAENSAPQIVGFTDLVRSEPIEIDITGGKASAGVRVGEDGFIGLVNAFDPDGDTLQFRIEGGADAALFQIDQLGEISLVDAVVPFGDEDGDNSYEFTLVVDDGNGGVATLEIDYFVIPVV